MAHWRDVRPRIQALQSADFGIYGDGTRRTLAVNLTDYVHGGDAVLFFNGDVSADEQPVVISLKALEALVARAGEKETV